MKKFILATLITVTIGGSVLAADISKVSFRVLNALKQNLLMPKMQNGL